MTEHPLYCFHVSAGANSQARGGVSQIEESHRLKIGLR